MTEPVIKTESLTVYRADSLELLPTLEGAGKVCQAVITDCAYWTLDKWRAVGTTTRLGGHRDEEKRSGWFETISPEDLFTLLCESARLLPKNGHAWFFADNEVQSWIQGYVREGETGFDYVKSYPVLKMRGDGQAPRMGMGYHLKSTHEYVVLCEKGRRPWSKELNNRPDYFQVPWTGDAETRPLTKDGKPYPTAKPVSIYRELTRLSSSEGETILDPFAGSGPLADAALVEKRKAVLIDKSADESIPSEPGKDSTPSRQNSGCPNCGSRCLIVTHHGTLTYDPATSRYLLPKFDEKLNRLAGVVCGDCTEMYDPSDELWDELEDAYAEGDG